MVPNHQRFKGAGEDTQPAIITTAYIQEGSVIGIKTNDGPNLANLRCQTNSAYFTTTIVNSNLTIHSSLRTRAFLPVQYAGT